jgi:hypothetical protein
MKLEAGGQGKFLLCPQGKAASPRFMGVIVLGGTERDPDSYKAHQDSLKTGI